MSSAVDAVQAAQERAARIRPKVGGFPYLAESLRQAGVTRCYFWVAAMSFVYVSDAGCVLQQGEPMRDGMADVAPFDQDALVTALRIDQAGESTFPEFAEACWRAGVVWYDIDLTARTCSYFGAAGDVYVESYPAVAM